MFHFVYKTINLINEKYYIGDHSTSNIEDHYLGSGVAIQKAIKKYGKINFQREILEFFNTKQEAFNAQIKYIKKYNTLSPNGYNLSPTGGMENGGFQSEISKEKIRKKRRSQIIKKGWHHSIESIEKIKEGVSKANKGRISPNKGNKYSEESKKKISESKKGIKNHNHSSNITIERKTKLLQNLQKDRSKENNGMFGKKHKEKSKELNRISHLKENLSKEVLEKMSKSARNKPKIICNHCGKYFTHSMHTRWHGNNCKMKLTK